MTRRPALRQLAGLTDICYCRGTEQLLLALAA
jgi:hypothetical protein